jgi:hypothetical protein
MDLRNIWQPAYLAAVVETDETAISTRLLEARAAMEQRRLLPVDTGGNEYRELKVAEEFVEFLSVKRSRGSTTENALPDNR